VPNLEPELHRLRLDRWRIVYAITKEQHLVDVLAVRKRPPYDYDDLEDLIAELL
jgi:mRNA interferase RelE/StbE